MASTDQIRTVLTKARALLDDPDHWTQGAMARTKLNSGICGVSPNYRDAACWCIVGAIRKVAPSVNIAMDTVMYLGGTAPTTTFNDTHQHPQVLAFLDTKIAALPAPNPDLET